MKAYVPDKLRNLGIPYLISVRENGRRDIFMVGEKR